MCIASKQVRRNFIERGPRLASQDAVSYIETEATSTTSMKGLAMGDKSKKDKDKNQKQTTTKHDQKSKATQDRNQKKP